MVDVMMKVGFIEGIIREEKFASDYGSFCEIL
jgi:hypothetical protein